MTLEDELHTLLMRVLRRAEELGNVSAACREAGISRSAFYQLRQRDRPYGPDSLHLKFRQGRPGRPPELGAIVARENLAMSLAWPSWGPRQPSSQLTFKGIEVVPGTVYRCLWRHGLARREQRYAVLEQQSAASAGLLTERTRHQLDRVRATPSRRHVEAGVAGELVRLPSLQREIPLGLVMRRSSRS